jgi:hypothetical protein
MPPFSLYPLSFIRVFIVHPSHPNHPLSISKYETVDIKAFVRSCLAGLSRTCGMNPASETSIGSCVKGRFPIDISFVSSPYKQDGRISLENPWNGIYLRRNSWIWSGTWILGGAPESVKTLRILVSVQRKGNQFVRGVWPRLTASEDHPRYPT